ncbi:MAG: glutamate racemase [Candidatus Thiodiazotropha sp.]
MSSNLPIGIFDSGVGGLSVLHHVRALLPRESLVYVADRGHIPYGNKSNDYITQRATLIADFLLQQPVKAIVVACNTATAAAVHTLRERYPIPIIGMEPGVKPAIAQSRTGLIGILATEGTLGSGKFKYLLERHANGADIFIKPCNGWVEEIERGRQDSAETARMVRETLEPLLAKGVDTLVLGCTHYPFLRRTIEQAAGDDIAIIDTGHAVATHLRRRLHQEGLLNDSSESAGETFWCSGPLEEMRTLVQRLWGRPCPIHALPDQANRS